MKKLFIILGLAFTMLIPTQLKANESEETVVCYFKKDDECKLVYICEDTNIIEPQQGVCIYPCIDPDID